MTATIVKLSRDDEIVRQYIDDKAGLRDTVDIWAAYWNGQLVIIWGLVPGSLLSDKAYIWSVSTDMVKRCPKVLLKIGRQVIAQLLAEYPTLVGVSDHKTKYVEHLGAQFTDEEINGQSCFMIRA